MSIQAHIESLTTKREHIKDLIADESAHPMPDFMRITALKKQNLTLKEEMKHYLSMLQTDSHQSNS